MNLLNFIWRLFKMIYKLLWCSASLISLIFNIFWFVCNLASAGIPWFTLVLLIICIASKFVKLRNPDEKQLINLIGVSNITTFTGSGISMENLSYWPIANRGAGYDAPENSKGALKKCIARGYRNVLLDANLTACGKIVIINRSVLEKAGFLYDVSKYTLEELKRINISELHPLGSQFEEEYVFSLTELVQFLNENHLIVYLLISDTSTHMIEKLKLFIKESNEFTNRTILVSRSPLAIYQLRKIYPELICGLWTEKSLSLSFLKTSTLITSIYGVLFRNIIAPVIGISVAFINKEEFNSHIAELWRNVGVRPIVYNVNSPNEKRYFQKTMKTQYLTDSLRSEPHLLMKA